MSYLTVEKHSIVLKTLENGEFLKGIILFFLCDLKEVWPCWGKIKDDF